MEKNGGGGAKLEGAEMRKILCARLRNGGGGDKAWATQVYNAYFKRNEKYSDPLSSPELFLWFCSS